MGSFALGDEMGEVILQAKGVQKSYLTKGGLFSRSSKKVVALNNLDLDIQMGEIFGLVGESGSGKSTFGRLIVRLEDPDSGRIIFDGKDITDLRGRELKSYRRKVQIIFQDPYQSLNPYLSVGEILREPLEIHGVKDGQGAIIEETMSLVGLVPPGAYLNAYTHQLSGGQRQRVAIARAMVLRPRFLVADEPTSMLDASISAQLFEILMSLKEEYGVTILFITHNLAAANYVCDRIGVLYKGHLVELGKSSDILTKPFHPYTMALLDAVPKFGRCDIPAQFKTLQREFEEGYEPLGCPFFKRCARARMVRCSNEIPALREVEEGHFSSCFYGEEIHQEIVGSKACRLGI